MLPRDGGNSLALDRQLCFALYAASRAVTRAYQPMLKTLGITYPQYLAMLVLWEWDEAGEEDASVGALGQRLMLDSGTLTPLLKRLQLQGLVERRCALWDERVTLLALTEAGRALRPRARAWVEQALERSPLAGAEREQLRSQLWKLLEELAAHPGFLG